ncbi:glycosyltransferase family 4 protein [Halochromatium glycolicum]|uniref:Glycosyltransferase n=1 Tax=Halochromatium glycolicum TaxID=85075 RepID=A0AAJ0U8G9_9GAMM|nr:glycosyltransferase family 4 protein [Halochromatium glycolicum]MBK1707274.1 hypothetical protein [Halochromatium glycolicum]
MKKIAIISPCVPRLTGAGAQQRAMNHLRALSTLAYIDLLVISDPLKQKKIPIETKELCNKCEILYHGKPHPSSSNKIIGSAFIFEVIESLKNWRSPDCKHIENVANFLNEADYDLIFCFRISTAMLALQLKHHGLIKLKRMIVDFDDIESIAIKRAVKLRHAEFGIEFSMIRRLHALRAKYLEKYLSKVSDGVIVCSHHDKNNVSKSTNNPHAFVIPNCIDIPAYIKDETPENKLSMLFVGSMSHSPNTDGIEWFTKNVYPLILHNNQVQSELIIVGYNPPKHIKKLEDEIPGIKVTGGVDTVKKYYEKCNVVIAPIRFGGGTRVKILEGMSYGRPVVSTSVGAEGINITKNENIFLADTTEAFAQMCLTLAIDRETRIKIAKNGRKLVSEQYSIDHFIAQETALIHTIMQLKG